MKNIEKRKLKNSVFKYSTVAIAILALLPLFFIIFYVFRKGLPVINWEFLTSVPKSIGESGGGVLNAMVGTLMLVIIASAIAVPIGIFAGVLISEHPDNIISKMLNLSVEILQGIPSIVIGLIGYIWIVRQMGHFSALSGGITLSIMMLPMIIKHTKETLELIPDTLKESAYALGIPYYNTLLKVILPSGLSGIFTGILLGLARIAGETAPLLFTAFGNSYLNVDILKPVAALPLLIYNYATSPYQEWHKISWGASCILVIFVLTLNIISRLVIKKWKIKY